MTTFFALRAATASFYWPATIHKCRIPPTVTVSVRYAAHRTPLPGSNHLRDRNIPYRMVHLVDESGSLGPSTPLAHIIASIDSKTHFVELVADNTECPIVKIKGKQEVFQKQKEWNKKQRVVASSNVQKEIQMTWGVESGDLGHKLKKARKELEKGNKVELVFAPKQNQKAPSPAIMDSRVKEVMGKMVDVAREWLPRKMENGVAVLYLRSLEEVKRPDKPSKPINESQ